MPVQYNQIKLIKNNSGVINYIKFITIKNMLNNIKNIEEYLYHFGLDHLEIYWTFKDELFIESHLVKIIAWYEIERFYNIPNYHYKIIFKKDWETIFAYYQWLRVQTIPTKDYVVIYSTWFRLILEEEIKFFLLQFYLWKVKRFDIASDLLIDIDSVLWEFKELTQKWATFNGPNWEIETQYIWDKKKTNKRQLIRIYNKIKDTQNRKKNNLYQDYLTQPHVTRVELEVRSELAKNRNYLDLFDVQILLWILKNYLYKHTQLFESLPWEKITLYQKEYREISKDDFQATFYRDQRRKVFIWHAKSIFWMWYCPVRILLWESLIQNDTKKFLDKDIVEIIWELEITLKRDEQFKRNEISERRFANFKKNEVK